MAQTKKSPPLLELGWRERGCNGRADSRLPLPQGERRSTLLRGEPVDPFALVRCAIDRALRIDGHALRPDRVARRTRNEVTSRRRPQHCRCGCRGGSRDRWCSRSCPRSANPPRKSRHSHRYTPRSGGRTAANRRGICRSRRTPGCGCWNGRRRRPARANPPRWRAGYRTRPAALPFLPQAVRNLPAFENLTTRALESPPWPSATKMSPLRAMATPVGRLK